MNCDGVSNLLSAYLDGELTPGELLRVEEHLRRCHACADEVDSLRQTIALVNSLEEVEVPATFQLQLHQRLVALGPPAPAVRRAPAAASLQRKAVRWAVPAAAAAAALAIGLTTLPPSVPIKGVAGGEATFNQPKSNQVANATNPTVTPATGTGSGTETAVKPPVQTTPPVKPDTLPDNSPIEIPPGNTNPGDKPVAVTTPGGEKQPEKQPAQMAYSANLTVAAPLDPKTVEALRSAYTLVDVVDNTVIVTVTPASFKDVLERLQKNYWPTAVRQDASRDLAEDLRTAESVLTAANIALEQLKKQPEADLTAAEADVKKAQEELDSLKSKTTKATIVVTFKPAP